MRSGLTRSWGEPGAAGIVIMRPTGLMLVLQNRKGEPDMTKGGIDGDESPWLAALREAREEAGIDDLAFPHGDASCFVGGTTRMHLAVTDQDVNIVPNPKTGVLEHTGHAWLPIAKARRLFERHDGYLLPAIDWAEMIIT